MTGQLAMICKTYTEINGKPVARVTFTLPGAIWADAIYLVGDFNHWNKTSHPMQRNRAGDWYLTIELDMGRAYQFRYLCDDGHWMNDSDGDVYVPNRYGTCNFAVVTDPDFRRYPAPP